MSFMSGGWRVVPCDRVDKMAGSGWFGRGGWIGGFGLGLVFGGRRECGAGLMAEGLHRRGLLWLVVVWIFVREGY